MEHDKELAQKIARYTPSPAALASIQKVPLLLAVGITAAGKDTVLRQMAAAYPDDYRFAVSHTTRALRENDGVMEQNGVEYNFIDKAAALRMLDEGAFVEANFFASNFYGMSIAEIKQAGEADKILISDIDVNGVDNFVRLGLNVKPVFLLPPSFEVWRQRLHQRYEGELNPDDLRKRLQTALSELEDALKHPYFYIVVNSDLDETVTLVNDIAHGRPTEARHPKAVALAQELASKITAELAKFTKAV
jgi:guanylate kinase